MKHFLITVFVLTFSASSFSWPNFSGVCQKEEVAVDVSLEQAYFLSEDDYETQFVPLYSPEGIITLYLEGQKYQFDNAHYFSTGDGDAVLVGLGNRQKKGYVPPIPIIIDLYLSHEGESRADFTDENGEQHHLDIRGACRGDGNW